MAGKGARPAHGLTSGFSEGAALAGRGLDQLALELGRSARNREHIKRPCNLQAPLRRIMPHLQLPLANTATLGIGSQPFARLVTGKVA